MRKLLKLAILLLSCAFALAAGPVPIDIERLSPRMLDEFNEYVQEREAFHLRGTHEFASAYQYIPWPEKGLNVFIKLRYGRNPALAGYQRNVLWKGLFTDQPMYRLLQAIEKEMSLLNPSTEREDKHWFRDELNKVLHRRQNESMPHVIRYTVNTLAARSRVIDRETIETVKQTVRELVDRRYGLGSYDTA